MVPVKLLSFDDARCWVTDGAQLVDARSLLQRGLHFVRGAVRFSWTDTTPGGRCVGVLDEPEVLAQRLMAVGIDWGRPIVVFDVGPGGWGEGARVAWTLAFMDHPAVGWCPGVPGSLPRPSRRQSVVAWTGRCWREARGVDGIEPPPGAVVVDCRDTHEFSVGPLHGEARAGHIPGAVHVPFGSLWAPDAPFGCPHPLLVDVLVENGVWDAPIVACVCTGGVRSAALVVLLGALGYPGRLVHLDAGMWAWAKDRKRPMSLDT